MMSVVLGVVNKPFRLSVVMLDVITLSIMKFSVTAHDDKCCYAGCRKKTFRLSVIMLDVIMPTVMALVDIALAHHLANKSL
jgi:hypothetical protein